MISFFRISLSAALAAFAQCAAAAPAFDHRFSDHMVLQRNLPIDVAGNSAPRARVTVELAGAKRTTTADAGGRWSATFPARAKGEDLTIVATDRSGSTTLRNVMIGDVWLCSGQSNMEYPVRRALNPDTELAGPFNDKIRLLKVNRAISVRPVTGLDGAPRWRVASADSVGDFSAVCYFMGRDLARTAGSPIGLIDASWGGSQIEAWISAPNLRKTGGFDEGLDMLALYETDPRTATEQFGRKWEAWWRTETNDAIAPWEERFDDARWTPVTPPMRDWKTYGDAKLTDHLGIVWFRNSIDVDGVPPREGEATLYLGAADEYDSVWLNGVFLGATFGWGDHRIYRFPASILKQGRNVLAVSVYNSWGAGGLTGPDDVMRIVDSGGHATPIDRGWVYTLPTENVGAPPRTPWESVSGLTGMSNAMIAPLEGARLKGAIWYQGESNVGRSDAYKGLLRALINDWRGKFGAELAFLVVQLPNFGGLATRPAPSAWADLREAQRRAAIENTNTGLVVAIDAGDRFDLHPPNKQVIGSRAAAVAAALDEKAPRHAIDGRSPAGAALMNDRVILEFSGVTPLSIAGAAPVPFEICDAAHACAAARAAIVGDSIEIELPDNRTSAFIRYCWADAPICNVVDKEGEPFSPFSMEISAGR